MSYTVCSKKELVEKIVIGGSKQSTNKIYIYFEFNENLS
jgi:hypothetical protein